MQAEWGLTGCVILFYETCDVIGTLLYRRYNSVLFRSVYVCLFDLRGSMIIDVLLDAVMDCLKDLPFLFAAFLFLEALEHHVSKPMNRALAGAGGLGPLAGAVLGCVPQCGFSIMASDFYSGGVISLGTLLAVYLSTSDEAVIILLSNPGRLRDVGMLILAKVVIGILFGYIVFFTEHAIRSRRRGLSRKDIAHLCDHCGCHDHNGGVLRGALQHTGEVLLFLFLFTFVLNLLLELIGLDNLSRLLLANTVFQPVLSALIGLIPNCGASVVLTQLYIDGVISFGSAISGLCAAAGLGLAVLYKVNRNRRENIGITVLLYGIAVISGVVLQFAVG